jgi:hypothetical protein
MWALVALGRKYDVLFACITEKCKALVALGRKYDVLLFAEDVYNLLHYSGEPHPPPRLLSYDNRYSLYFVDVSQGNICLLL